MPIRLKYVQHNLTAWWASTLVNKLLKVSLSLEATYDEVICVPELAKTSVSTLAIDDLPRWINGTAEMTSEDFTRVLNSVAIFNERPVR